MTKNNSIPKFPEGLPVPNQIKETCFHPIVIEDFETNKDFEEVVHILYDHPEHDVCLYLERGGVKNRNLKEELEKIGIIFSTTEFYYYKHPKFERSFLKITKDMISSDWLREVVEKGPMFGLTILKLSERKRRSLEIHQKILCERESNANPLELKPNFCGLGIDLAKIPMWLRKFKKKQ